MANSPTCSAAKAPAPASQRSQLTLCLITDRQRLLRATRADPAMWDEVLLAQITGAAAGGVDVVQIRERGLNDGEYVRFVRRAVAATAGNATRIVVNDRLDIALAAGAAGVHLREDSVPVAAVRRLVRREFLVGRSVHAAATAVEQRSADYLIAGSVFETVSKPGATALGLDGLRAIVQAAGGCPVWALGGVTASRARALSACGVQGVAAIGAFIPEAPPHKLATMVQKLTRGLRFSFDSTAELP